MRRASAGFASYTSATSGAGIDEAASTTEVSLVDSSGSDAAAQRELVMDVLLSEDSNLVQETAAARVEITRDLRRILSSTRVGERAPKRSGLDS